jgi:hypothetical protein
MRQNAQLWQTDFLARVCIPRNPTSRPRAANEPHPAGGRHKEAWMNVPVAVTPTLARSRPGLLNALRVSGFLADEPADLFAWAERPGRSAIILSLSTDDELSAVARLQGRADVVVVALLTDPRPRAYREVLAAGGFPVAWDVPATGIVGALRAAIDGQVLVPRRVATGLAGNSPRDVGPRNQGPGWQLRRAARARSTTARTVRPARTWPRQGRAAPRQPSPTTGGSLPGPRPSPDARTRRTRLPRPRAGWFR